MFKRLLTTGLLFGMAATAPPALAQGCAPRDHIVERLKEGYAESLAGAGLQASAMAMLEVWSNPESGSFTVLLTNPDGVSCILSHGSDYYTIEQLAEAEGELG
ncbi:MAG: hypothetical protein ACU0E9_00965 [Limimaricola soesokkakensis]|uniref:Lipoprotein n=1 Tax=Limimaricola variabilis TaxID=1492771 RepID=A0ABR6HNB4_9RHOB|nr:hypothetical protein [Limimaricola variabilis]MBB3711896.1 hypothetical protein [Limimaricola variabilis]WPY96678.1 hypothetical protein T8T21_19235 [Limimaricola variabilis]